MLSVKTTFQTKIVPSFTAEPDLGNEHCDQYRHISQRYISQPILDYILIDEFVLKIVKDHENCVLVCLVGMWCLGVGMVLNVLMIS